MKPKQEPFTPEELEPILILASECGMILVGGQAVNSWALLLEKPEDEPWKSLRPYTSLDADMLCSEYQMLKFAKTLSDSGWGVEVSPHSEDLNFITSSPFYPPLHAVASDQIEIFDSDDLRKQLPVQRTVLDRFQNVGCPDVGRT